MQYFKISNGDHSMVSSPQPLSRIDLGEHVVHVHHLLPHESALVRAQLRALGVQQVELNDHLQDAVSQSSETNHDNAPRDAVVDAQGTLIAGATHILQVWREKEVIDYPSPEDPTIQIGSRVTLNMNGGKAFTTDIVGFATDKEDDSIIEVTYTTPLAQALLGHETSDKYEAEIGDGTQKIGILAVDQCAIRDLHADELTNRDEAAQ